MLNQLSKIKIKLYFQRYYKIWLLFVQSCFLSAPWHLQWYTTIVNIISLYMCVSRCTYFGNSSIRFQTNKLNFKICASKIGLPANPNWYRCKKISRKYYLLPGETRHNPFVTSTLSVFLTDTSFSLHSFRQLFQRLSFKLAANEWRLQLIQEQWFYLQLLYIYIWNVNKCAYFCILDQFSTCK